MRGSGAQVISRTVGLEKIGKLMTCFVSFGLFFFVLLKKTTVMIHILLKGNKSVKVCLFFFSLLSAVSYYFSSKCMLVID